MLVGVGTASASEEPVALMAAAASAAADDAGARSLLGAIDRIAVPQGTWSYPDPARLVAEAVGAKDARTTLAEIGVPQQTLVTQALSSIAEGSSDVTLVVGGEARAWARLPGHTEREQVAVPDEVERREPDFYAPCEVAAGMLVPPVQQYALIENALGHAEGRTPADDADEIDHLWARFNAVADTNPAAAFAEPRSAADLGAPGRGYRLPVGEIRRTIQWVNIPAIVAALVA